MSSPTISTAAAAAIFLFYGNMQLLHALSCWGSDALDTTANEAYCVESNAMANSMSLCLYHMAASVAETCTTDHQCMTVSVAPSQSSSDSDNSSQLATYRFAGCYKRETYVNLCFGEQSFETDPMPTDGTLSVAEETTTSAATRSSTTASMTTSRVTTARPTTATALSSTGTSTLYPNVGSCAYSAVTFSHATCVVGASARVRLVNGTGGSVDVNVTITSCCKDTDQCNNYGSRPEFSSWCYTCDGSEGAEGCDRIATCAGDCWAYTTTVTTKASAGSGGVRNRTYRGCGVGSAPLRWSSLTSLPQPSSCTASFQQPVCNVTSSGTVCFRCCAGYLCNDWDEVATVVPKKTLSSGQDRATAAVTLTVVAITVSTILSQFAAHRATGHSASPTLFIKMEM